VMMVLCTFLMWSHHDVRVFRKAKISNITHMWECNINEGPSFVNMLIIMTKLVWLLTAILMLRKFNKFSLMLGVNPPLDAHDSHLLHDHICDCHVMLIIQMAY
jgi:hypothetical protein